MSPPVQHGTRLHPLQRAAHAASDIERFHPDFLKDPRNLITPGEPVNPSTTLSTGRLRILSTGGRPWEPLLSRPISGFTSQRTGIPKTIRRMQ
jgi:hypothetical protein